MLEKIIFKNGMEIKKNLCSCLNLTVEDLNTGNWVNRTVADTPLTITHGKAYDLIMNENTEVSEVEKSIIVKSKDCKYYIHSEKH